MPNWCSNELKVTGPDVDIKAFIEKARGYYPWFNNHELRPLNFHSLVPIPEQVLKAGYEEAGYNWEKANWGCKWGACITEVADVCPDCVMYFFDTAWSPPIEFITTVAKQWPSLQFEMSYDEPGIGFSGTFQAKGDWTEDNCVTS